MYATIVEDGKYRLLVFSRGGEPTWELYINDEDGWRQIGFGNGSALLQHIVGGLPR